MELKVMLYNCSHTVCRDSNKYLDTHSHFSCSPERLNFNLIRKYAIFIMFGFKFFNDFVLKVSSLTYNTLQFQ